MSVVTLFTRKAPTMAGLEFDAVLEDTFESSVVFTQFPIEAGANATDHGIIQPNRWTLTGAISNNPLQLSVTDFAGALSNFAGSGALAGAAGLSAGFLSGSDDTRASDALSLLIEIKNARQPFDIDAGDITLTNMVITNITRTKNPANEGALVFVAELQELPTLDTVLSQGQPKQEELTEGDPAQSQASSLIDKGEQALSGIGDSISSLVDGILS